MALIRRENGNERSLARSQSWDPFQLMQQMMNWDPLAEVTRPLAGSGGTFTPRFEVKETKDSFVFRGDLPGLQEKDLEVSLTGNRLTISGKREEEHRDESDRYFAYERSFGSFSRTFTLPEGVDPDHVNADLSDGVLTISVPKKEHAQPKRIQLKSGKKEGSVKA